MLDEIGNLDPFTPEQLQEMLSIGLDRTEGPAVKQATSHRPILQSMGQLREAFPDVDNVLQAYGDEPFVFRMERPTVVCLCGSTRFRQEIADVNARLTLTGSIVLAPGVFAHDGDEITEDQKRDLDALHLRKIDMADEVLVVDLGGYVGESTSREIVYAREHRKPLYFLSTMQPL